MKFIEQISTGEIVFRESPHRVDSNVLYNASISTGIPLADLQVADKPFSEEQYAEAIQNQRPYPEKRRREYPDIGDQLDALYHAGVFPTDMAAKIKIVKDKFPKE